MAITLIIGKPKKGKTLLMRAMMQYLQYDEIYCNLKLNGLKYKKVDNARDILDLPQNKQSKGLFLDEINRLIGDSWNYDELAELMANIATQHRKYRADIIGTVQHTNMTINRLRENCDKIYVPLEIYPTPEGKPAFMKIAHIEFDDFERPYYNKPFFFPLFKQEDGHSTFACDLYDTYEFVKPLNKLEDVKNKEMLEKYHAFDVLTVKKDGKSVSDPEKMRGLKSILTLDEGIKVGTATQIANKISYNQRNKIT